MRSQWKGTNKRIEKEIISLSSYHLLFFCRSLRSDSYGAAHSERLVPSDSFWGFVGSETLGQQTLSVFIEFTMRMLHINRDMTSHHGIVNNAIVQLIVFCRRFCTPRRKPDNCMGRDGGVQLLWTRWLSSGNFHRFFSKFGRVEIKEGENQKSRTTLVRLSKTTKKFWFSKACRT